MTTATATRHLSKARSEVEYDGRAAARRAYSRTARRAAAAEIADELAECPKPRRKRKSTTVPFTA